MLISCEIILFFQSSITKKYFTDRPTHVILSLIFSIFRNKIFRKNLLGTFLQLKKRKNIHRGVLLLVNFTKVALIHGCFFRFSSINGTKSRRASHIENIVEIISHMEKQICIVIPCFVSF